MPSNVIVTGFDQEKVEEFIKEFIDHEHKIIKFLEESKSLEELQIRTALTKVSEGTVITTINNGCLIHIQGKWCAHTPYQY